MVELIEWLEKALERGIVIQPRVDSSHFYGWLIQFADDSTQQPQKDPGSLSAEPQQQHRGW